MENTTKTSNRNSQFNPFHYALEATMRRIALITALVAAGCSPELSPCNDSTQCLNGLQCITGLCLPAGNVNPPDKPCTEDNRCGVGTVCNQQTGKCDPAPMQQADLGGMNTDASLPCGTPGGRCGNNGICRNDGVCVEPNPQPDLGTTPMPDLGPTCTPGGPCGNGGIYRLDCTCVEPNPLVDLGTPPDLTPPPVVDMTPAPTPDMVTTIDMTTAPAADMATPPAPCLNQCGPGTFCGTDGFCHPNLLPDMTTAPTPDMGQAPADMTTQQNDLTLAVDMIPTTDLTQTPANDLSPLPASDMGPAPDPIMRDQDGDCSCRGLPGTDGGTGCPGGSVNPACKVLVTGDCDDDSLMGGYVGVLCKDANGKQAAVIDLKAFDYSKPPACPMGYTLVFKTDGSILNGPTMNDTIGDRFDNDCDGKVDEIENNTSPCTWTKGFQDMTHEEWIATECPWMQ